MFLRLENTHHTGKLSTMAETHHRGSTRQGSSLCQTMVGKINIEEVRGFLEASNRQFEQGGIYLERALFKRDDNGVLTGITLSYEDRTTSDTQETRKEKQV